MVIFHSYSDIPRGYIDLSQLMLGFSPRSPHPPENLGGFALLLGRQLLITKALQLLGASWVMMMDDDDDG